MTKRRLEPQIRRDEILRAGIKAAEKHGFNNFTREQVSSVAGCAESLISAYFGTMTKFRRTVMRHAVNNENLNVIAQGLVINDKHALKADPDLKKRALGSLGL